MAAGHRSPNEPMIRFDNLTSDERATTRRFYRTWRSVADRRKARYEALLHAHSMRGYRLSPPSRPWQP